MTTPERFINQPSWAKKISKAVRQKSLYDGFLPELDYIELKDSNEPPCCVGSYSYENRLHIRVGKKWVRNNLDEQEFAQFIAHILTQTK